MKSFVRGDPSSFLRMKKAPHRSPPYVVPSITQSSQHSAGAGATRTSEADEAIDIVVCVASAAAAAAAAVVLVVVAANSGAGRNSIPRLIWKLLIRI